MISPSRAEVLISELERVKLGQLPESILKALKEVMSSIWSYMYMHIHDTYMSPLSSFQLYMVNTELETSPSTSSTSSSSLCSTSVQSQQSPWQEPVSSTEWLKENSLEGIHMLEYHTFMYALNHKSLVHYVAAGLSIYKVLAPNAYSQLETHVETTDRSVTSTVYDVSEIYL